MELAPEGARLLEEDTEVAESIRSVASDGACTVLSPECLITSSADTSRPAVVAGLAEPPPPSERGRGGETPRLPEAVPAAALTLTESVDSGPGWWLTRSRSSSDMRLRPRSIWSKPSTFNGKSD